MSLFMEPKGHHRRGYLPHRDYGGALQAITFREADSLPAHVVESWKEELQHFLNSPDDIDKAKAHDELLRRIARYEDAGYGRCLLRQPNIARIVHDKLIEGHGKGYELIAWCVMPNHVHVLIRQEDHALLGKIVRSWKGGSARQINLVLQSRGAFWARDYFDRAIRDQDHYWRSVAYIEGNPVKAGLVKEPGEWEFSSKGCGWNLPE